MSRLLAVFRGLCPLRDVTLAATDTALDTRKVQKS
jgi:hypothetical protein